MRDDISYSNSSRAQQRLIFKVTRPIRATNCPLQDSPHRFWQKIQNSLVYKKFIIKLKIMVLLSSLTSTMLATEPGHRFNMMHHQFLFIFWPLLLFNIMIFPKCLLLDLREIVEFSITHKMSTLKMYRWSASHTYLVSHLSLVVVSR